MMPPHRRPRSRAKGMVCCKDRHLPYLALTTNSMAGLEAIAIVLRHLLRNGRQSLHSCRQLRPRPSRVHLPIRHWMKYKYVLSAAFGSGVAISPVLIFCLEYPVNGTITSFPLEAFRYRFIFIYHENVFFTACVLPLPAAP